MEAVVEETAKSALERSLADSFRERRSPRDPEWLVEIRRDAMERLNEIGFPSMRQEDWKYTNVAPILKTAFVSAPEEGPRRVDWIVPDVLKTPSLTTSFGACSGSRASTRSRSSISSCL